MADDTTTPDAQSTVPLTSPDGEISFFSPEAAQLRTGLGYSPSTPEDFARKQYTSVPQSLLAHSEAGLSGLTVGLSDVIAKGLGRDPQEMARRRQYNPTTKLTEMLGAGIPLAAGVDELAPLFGAASLAGRGIGTAAALAGETAAGGAASEIGARMLAGSLVGGAYGAGHELSEESLGDMPFNVDAVLEQAGMGAVGGGVGEGLFGIAGRALSPAARVARGALGKLGELGESTFDRVTSLASGASAEDIRALRLRRIEAANAGGYGPMAAQDVASAENELGGIKDEAAAKARETYKDAQLTKEQAAAEKASTINQARGAGETAFNATRDLRDQVALEGGKALKDFHENIHPAAQAAQKRLIQQGEGMMAGRSPEDAYAVSVQKLAEAEQTLAGLKKLPKDARDPTLIKTLKGRLGDLQKAVGKVENAIKDRTGKVFVHPAVEGGMPGPTGWQDVPGVTPKGGTYGSELSDLWHAWNDFRKGAQGDAKNIYDQMKSRTLPWSKRPMADVATAVARHAGDFTKSDLWGGFGEKWTNWQEPYSRLLSNKDLMLKSRNFRGYDMEKPSIEPGKYPKYIKEIHTDPTAARGKVLDAYTGAGHDVLRQMDEIYKTPLTSKEGLKAMLRRLSDIKERSLDMTGQLSKKLKGYQNDALAAAQGKLQGLNDKIDVAKDIRRQGLRELTEQNIADRAGDVKPLEAKLSEAQRVQQLIKDLNGGGGGLGRIGYASFIGHKLGLSWAEMGPLLGAYAVGKAAAAPVRLLEGYTQIEMAARAMERAIGEDTKAAFKTYLSRGTSIGKGASYREISEHLLSNPLSEKGENEKDLTKAATQIALDINHASNNVEDTVGRLGGSLQFMPAMHHSGMAAKYMGKIGYLKQKLPILLPPIGLNTTPSMTPRDALKFSRTYFNVNKPIQALNTHLAAGDLRSSDIEDAVAGGGNSVQMWQGRMAHMLTTTKDIPYSKQAQLKVAIGANPHAVGYATQAQAGYQPAPPTSPSPKAAAKVPSQTADTRKFKSELASTERLPADAHLARIQSEDV